MILTRVIMAILLMTIPAISFAEMEYEIGYMNSFSEGNQHGARLQIGNSRWPVYTWAGYDPAELRILGQGVADADILSVGLGASHSWNEFSVFMDLGYAFINENVNQVIADEIVYTELVRNHNVTDARPIPAADPTRPYGFGGQDLRYHPDNARTSYAIEDSFIGRVGIGYQVHKRVKITASYRFLTPKENIELWDVERRANTGGYWVENREKDLGAFEFGIHITF